MTSMRVAEYGNDEESNTPLVHKDLDGTESTSILASLRGMSKKKKVFVCLGTTIVCTLFFLLITFLAIIPAIMKDLTNEEEITMSTLTILNPTDEKFDVAAVVSFSKKPPLEATAKLHNTVLSWEGKHLAVMTHNNKLNVETSPQVLHSSVVVADLEAFTSFNEFAMTAESFIWSIHGHSDVIALNDKVDIVIDKDISMLGFNNFPVDPVIESVSTYKGTVDYLYSASKAVIFSASNIALDFGQDIHFVLKSNGLKIGTGTIPACTFSSGSFTVLATIAMSRGSTLETQEMDYVCGRYISGFPSDVTMEGFWLDSPVSWLAPALAGITLRSVLPPVTQGVTDSIDMYLHVGDIVNVEWVGNFYDPLDEMLTLLSMQCDISFEGALIAIVNEPMIHIAIPSKTHVKSPTVMHATTVLTSVKELMDLINKGGGLLDLDCQIKSSVGDFTQDLHYTQKSVPSTIHQGRPPIM